MKIKTLKLINFRNIENLNAKFSQNINLITGDNAQGKTNLLEAVYYVLTGYAFKASKTDELINLKKNQAYVGCVFEEKGLEKQIEVLLERNKSRRIKLNGKEIKSFREVENYFPVSLFTPEDLLIIKGSPALRRKFFDNFYSLFSGEYAFYFGNYNKILRERNKLLKDYEFSLELLNIYDIQLSEHGIKIEELREMFRIEMEKETEKLLCDFSGGKDRFAFKGDPEMREILNSENPKKAYLKKLKSFLNADRDLKFTNFGSHISDFYLYINDKLSKIYASQGQQRTLILSLEFAMVNFWIKKGIEPILLLDDVFSELDEERSEFFYDYIKSLQTFITQTSFESIKGDGKLFKMKEGRIYD